jgi:hypothetical protein
MVSNCATPIKGTHMRIVKVDTCGSPVTGTSSLVAVTKGFVQVQMEPQYEEGDEFFQRTADGTICVNQKDNAALKRFNLTIDFCEINVSASAFMVTARELTVGSSPTTGYGFAMAEGVPTNRFSLEVWQQVAGSGACDPSTGAQRYIYHAWPNIGNGKLGSYTIQNDRSTLQILGETQAASMVSTIGWGDGPGSGTSWLPAGQTVQTGEHWLWTITTSAPPTPACSPTTLT